MTEQKIKTILEKHKLWVNDEKDGERANLYVANLERANLRGANLERANLERANLYVANLERANLRGANLERANLEGANLYVANLEGANLEGANLELANLKGANLRGANLKGAKIHENYTIQGKLYQLTNVGSENGTLIIADCEEGWYFNRGCFRGGKDEFLEAVKETHGKNKHAKFYKKIVKLYTEVL